MYTLSVSALNEQIKGLLEESFNRVLVEGELSRITFHNSGHIYFTLKDASSSIRAVMFRGNASKLKFQLKEGQKVILDGALTLYKPRGEYQINCFSIEPSGQGALALAYEQLKQKLSSQGYFNPETKKQLPQFPTRLALITSATGAALQDMLRVASSRYKNIEIDIYDVLVQGEKAAFEIANAIIYADRQNYDVLITGRGGGSIEDLWAFNEEIVADAIFRATTPIVSAVGHEIDWVISDFVADVRAATPSNAMQIVLPDAMELLQYLDSISSGYTQALQQKFHSKNQELQHLFSSYSQHSIEKKLSIKRDEIENLKKVLTQNIDFKLHNSLKEISHIKENYPYSIQAYVNSAQNRVNNLQKMFESHHPKLKSKVGFAQISRDGKIIELSSLAVDEIFEVQDSEYSIHAQVVKKIKFQ